MRASFTRRAIYNGFLLESLGAETNGMELSVLSALARTGLDPWAEAERLASLPKWAAAQAIRGTLAPLVDAVEARELADLLPVREPRITPPPLAANDEREFLKTHGLAIAVLWLAILVGFVLVSPASRAIAPTTQSGASSIVK